MSTQPKLVCFDWDGTLIDSFDKIAKCILETGKLLGFKSVKLSQVKSKIGLSLEELLCGLYGDVDVAQFQKHYERVYLDLAPPLLFPGCAKMLRALKEKDILVAIVTNKSRLSLEAELLQTGVSKYIDSIWVAEEYAAKPSPIMLHHAMTSHQLSSNDVWMVGDSLPDLYSACAASVGKVVLVEDLPIPNWVSTAVLIDDLSEIVSLIYEGVKLAE